jgi:hypothetical protein
MSDKEQMMYLVHYLSDAMREHPEISGSSYALRHRTDVVGIAKQYGGLLKIKREDYDKIKDLTIGEIIDMFNDGYIVNKKYEHKKRKL